MRRNSGFSIYTVISIIAFAALIFILALPQFFNLNKREKTDECVKNMKIIYRAVENYMNERGESFTEDTQELIRTGYLKKTFECPENGAGDKYQISGNFETGEISVTCPHEDVFKDHKLPESFK